MRILFMTESHISPPPSHAHSLRLTPIPTTRLLRVIVARALSRPWPLAPQAATPAREIITWIKMASATHAPTVPRAARWATS